MTSRIHTEPEYTCEVCGTPMVQSTIRHTYTPQDNTAPAYFCSIGCYYTWAEGAHTEYHDEEQYDR
jgi:hypothetical protein